MDAEYELLLARVGRLYERHCRGRHDGSRRQTLITVTVRGSCCALSARRTDVVENGIRPWSPVFRF